MITYKKLGRNQIAVFIGDHEYSPCQFNLWADKWILTIEGAYSLEVVKELARKHQELNDTPSAH